MPKKELKHHVQGLADHLEIVVKSRCYDSEKGILKKLLGAREDQVIVLYWNSKSKECSIRVEVAR